MGIPHGKGKGFSQESAQMLRAILGEEGATIMNLLSQQPLTDEEITKKTHLRVNLVRKILYKLHELKIATYRGVRDKKTGWYVYHWCIHPERIDALLWKRRRKALQLLDQRLRYELSTMFFRCRNEGHPKLTFDVATEYGFKCPDCGDTLEHIDNSQVVETLKNHINCLREAMNSNNKDVNQ